jgi:hypothetical protein
LCWTALRFVAVRLQWAGIAQSVRDGRSGDRIPVGTRFSAHVQTAPGAHPASYTMGTASFPGIKRPGRGVDHPPNLTPRLKKEYSYTSNSTSGPSWTVLGRTFTFTFTFTFTLFRSTHFAPNIISVLSDVQLIYGNGILIKLFFSVRRLQVSAARYNSDCFCIPSLT